MDVGFISNYKISVIIPVYNVKNYLVESIESLINQTIGFENIQVIIIDDCSTDGSKEIIMEYEKKYDNILAIYRKNNSGGCAVPRNDGLKHVKADYIMFLDPDDLYAVDYCETLYKKITDNDVDLVKCNSTDIMDDGKKSRNPYFSKEIDEVKIECKNNSITRVVVWSGIHKTDIIKRNNIYFPDCVGEDLVFTINEWVHIENMIYLNNYFGYMYRLLDDSHAIKSTNKDIKKISRYLCCFKLAVDIGRSHNRLDLINKVIGYQVMWLFNKLMENQNSSKSKKLVLNEIYNLLKNLPDLIVPNSIYKIAILLTKHKLFNLTIVYLNILKACKHSNLMKRIYRKVVLR